MNNSEKRNISQISGSLAGPSPNSENKKRKLNFNGLVSNMENLNMSVAPLNQISQAEILKSKSDLKIVKEMLEKIAGNLQGKKPSMIY